MEHDYAQGTPEGRLISAAANASGLSVRRLAANANVSETRWRQVARGWQPDASGNPVPAKASAETLARMAWVVGVTPEQLVEAGRGDAAGLLATMGDAGRASLTLLPGGARRAPDEIDMIYASQTMTAAEKLERIRQVLTLREQAERDGKREAPSEDGACLESADVRRAG